jgi:hypothetical protein
MVRGTNLCQATCYTTGWYNAQYDQAKQVTTCCASTSATFSNTAHLWICTDLDDECHQPGSGAMEAPPSHKALGTHWSHVLLRGSSEYHPQSQVWQASPVRAVTSPMLQFTTCTTIVELTPSTFGATSVRLYVPAEQHSHINNSMHPSNWDDYGSQQALPASNYSVFIP